VRQLVRRGRKVCAGWREGDKGGHVGRSCWCVLVLQAREGLCPTSDVRQLVRRGWEVHSFWICGWEVVSVLRSLPFGAGAV